MTTPLWIKDATKKTSRFVRLGNVVLWKFIKWSSENIKRRDFIILVSILTGIVAGIAAMILKSFVHYLQDLVEGDDPSSENLWYMIFPVIGISLSVIFIKYILKRKTEKGLSTLIYQISRKKVRIPSFETFSHMVTSGLTVGLGGSVGLEAPIIRTGSAIGSNLARIMKLGRKDQTLILACGAAAGTGAIFNSPIAGVIFAFEVLMPEIGIGSFIPLLISAATGAVVARFLYSEQIFFLITDGWEVHALPFYIIMGILTGLVSAYIIRTVIKVENLLLKYKHQYTRILLGGIALGIFIFLMPPLYGEGYLTVNDLLEGRYHSMADHSIFYRWSENDFFLLAFGLVLVFAKIVASGFTMGAGGNGGIFASSMFTGATLGFVFVHAINMTGLVELRDSNFIAVAMGGILSGVMSAPLTGVFIIAEVTGGYALFVPLMIVSALSYFVTRRFEKHSVFTKILAEKGVWAHPDDRDASVLMKMSVADLLEKDFISVRPEYTLGLFVKAIANSRRNIFPVTDNEGKLMGIILLDDVREIMFDQEKYEEVTVAEIMHDPLDVVQLNETMD
ncbi:MAG: chloride channel protein, partial [Saprospiraceae bacterium]|nr:chloride channel protein [Saprospiraceae bacterium]